MQEFLQIIQDIRITDLIDIVLVSIPFYLIFALLKEARSATALWGIVTLLGLSLMLILIAKVVGLQATALIYEQFWLVVVLLFLIMFQSELKRAMTELGRMRFFAALFPHESRVIGEIVDAVQEMAIHRVGALIVFERDNTLKPYLATGTPLDAVVSARMVGSIFARQSPLHDGALIVSGERLVAASCILPLTDDPNLSKDLGTRHRAAMGLTEETDSLVVVVSEETGSIAISIQGKIERPLKPDALRKRLELELDAFSPAED